MKFFQLYKKEFFSFLGCFCVFFLVAGILSSVMIHYYKQNLLLNNVHITNELLVTHPELEQEIIQILKNSNRNYDVTILNKYGFMHEDWLSYLSYVQDVEQKTTRILFYSFGGCFLLFFLIVLYFYYRKYRRICDINDYLFRVLQNDYKMNLKDYQEDSISLLKNDLLKVTNKLRNMSEKSFQDKKQLEQTLSDISHQLRTPLTSLTIINDILSSNSVSLDEEKKFLNQQREQLERMEWLIVTLLKMSQIDSGTIQFSMKEESVLKIVQEALKPSLIPLELKQITVNVSIDENLTCSLDYRWTVEAFVNIIKNAMEHTNPNGHLNILATDNPMFVEIQIQDDGVGISKEDLPHIFERFYKCNTKSESIGIGLNLSKTIIEKQHGVVSVFSKPKEGTTFIIRFLKVTV